MTTKDVRDLLRLTAFRRNQDLASHARSISVLESGVAALCDVLDHQDRRIDDLVTRLAGYEKVLGAPSDVLDGLNALRKALGKK